MFGSIQHLRPPAEPDGPPSQRHQGEGRHPVQEPRPADQAGPGALALRGDNPAESGGRGKQHKVLQGHRHPAHLAARILGHDRLLPGRTYRRRLRHQLGDPCAHGTGADQYVEDRGGRRAGRRVVRGGEEVGHRGGG